MKKIFILLSLYSIVFDGFSQSTIYGTVLDQNNQPVIGANAYLEDSYDGATTDLNGIFSFSTSEKGSKSLLISFIGYEKHLLPILIEDKDIHLEVILKESINELNAVVITAGSFTAGEEASREVLKPLDIVTTAGATADIAGVLNTLPGTQTVGETGKLFVRGGSGEETKTFINGNQVLHPYLSTSSNTPGRGRFSPFMFSGTSFSTGGYSAEYGQALSSALILNSKEIQNKTRTDLSLMSVGGGITHTQKIGSGAVVAGLNYFNLRPYFEVVKQKFDYEQAPVNYQGDLIFQQKLENNDMFKFYTNVNFAEFEIYEPSIADNSLRDNIKNYNDYYYLNSTYQKIINDQWSLKSGISFTSFNNKISINDESYDEGEKSMHIKTVAAHEASRKVSFIIGAEQFIRSYSFKFQNEEHGNIEFGESLTSLFAEADVYTSNKFVTRLGIRGEYNSLQENFYATPRISLAYKVDKNSQVSLAYGLFNQTGSNEFIRINQSLKDEFATHYILNYQREIDGRTFRVEGYYKNYDKLIKYSNPLDPMSFTNDGDGYAKGFDIFWRDGKSIEGLDYWISYSFLDSERDYRNFPEQATPYFASKHNFSAVGKYFIGSLKTQVGATYSFTSGRPYYDPNKEGFNNSITKPYHDLSANLSYLLGSNIIIHASVTNVLGIKNVFGYQASTTPNDNGDYTLTPITPPAPRFIFLGVFITLSKDKGLNQLPNL